MNFLSLNVTGQGVITAVVMVGFTAVTLALIVNIIAKNSKKSTFVLSLLLVAIIVDLSALMEFINFSREDPNLALSTLAQAIDKIPHPLHVILGLASVGISIFSIYKVYKAEKDKINDFSIKEALESLPTGIAFVSEDNTIYLSNKIMHNLCKELTGKDLISGIDIWGELYRLKSSEKCVMKEENPAFILQGGKVWQFSKTVQKRRTGNYIEIKATDITELYNLGRNVGQMNELLLQQQARLEVLSGMIEQSTEEELTANMKVDFHDHFGSLLASTKQTLMQSEPIETKVIAGHLTKLSDIISGLAEGDKPNLSLHQIQAFGKKLGCEVTVEGDLPTDDENKTTILLCINEALINAYRHANADKLTVTITETDHKVNVTIQSKTKTPLTEITEGGGLTGLRQKVERSGGSFSVKADDEVTIFVQLGIRR